MDGRIASGWYPNLKKTKPLPMYNIESDVTALLGPGVFILSHNGHVTYVGKARCLLVALNNERTISRVLNLPIHLPVKRKIFDSISVIPCDTTQAHGIAKALIDLHNPYHNRANPEPRTPPIIPPQGHPDRPTFRRI